MSDNELPSVAVLVWKKTSFRRGGDFFPILIYRASERIVDNILLAFGMKCYPSSTHNFTLGELLSANKIPREKIHPRKIRISVYSNKTRRSLPECCTLVRISAKENKVAFVRAEVGNEEGWVRLPSESLSISRYWTRDDTRERAPQRITVSLRIR